MEIRLQQEVMTSATQALDARADELASRATQIEASVASLLGGWRGDAADRFATHWEEWRSSAALVLDHLGADIAAVRHAGAQLTDVDTDRGQAHTRLSRRLG